MKYTLSISTSISIPYLYLSLYLSRCIVHLCTYTSVSLILYLSCLDGLSYALSMAASVPIFTVVHHTASPSSSLLHTLSVSLFPASLSASLSLHPLFLWWVCQCASHFLHHSCLQQRCCDRRLQRALRAFSSKPHRSPQTGDRMRGRQREREGGRERGRERGREGEMERGAHTWTRLGYRCE